MSVAGRLSITIERAVGQDDALPDDERALLAEGDDVVVLADEAGALRDQQVAAGDGVVDVLGHLGDDEAGQIGVEAADQAGGDDGAGHQLVRRRRLLQAVRIVDFLLGAGLQEGELARLIGRVVRQSIDIAGRNGAGALSRAQCGQRCQIAVRGSRTRARNWIGTHFGGGASRGGAFSCKRKNTATSRAWPAMRASRAFSTRSASAIGHRSRLRQLAHPAVTAAGPCGIASCRPTPS